MENKQGFEKRNNEIEYTDIFNADRERTCYEGGTSRQAGFSPIGNSGGRRGFSRSMRAGVILGVLITSVIMLLGNFFAGSLNSVLLEYKHSALSASGDPAALPDEVFEKKMESIKKMIDENYIFDYKKSQIQDGILKGLVDSLNDPYSQYYTAREFQAAMEQYNGAYTGIGVVVRQSDDKRSILILNVYSGSPAEKAGIKQGDIIVEIEGEKILPETPFENTIALIRGAKGTKVELSVIRGKETKPRIFKVLREEISVDTVYSQVLENKIGYIRVFEFSGHTTDEFDKAYQNIMKAGAEKMIIDLRDNPGGSFSTVCKMLDGFLSDGVIVYTEDKSGYREYVRADKEIKYNLPMAVLVNGNSASASEIFSGTVKDRKLGLLVGEKTYGKGIVQNTIPFSDGTAIKLTISRYYTASGKEIHGKGIAPDIKVIYRQPDLKKKKEISYKDDNQIMRAIKALK